MILVHSNAKKNFGVDKQSRSGEWKPFVLQTWRPQAGHCMATIESAKPHQISSLGGWEPTQDVTASVEVGVYLALDACSGLQHLGAAEPIGTVPPRFEP